MRFSLCSLEIWFGALRNLAVFADVTNGSSKSEPSKLDGQDRSSYQGGDSSRHLHAKGRNGFLLNHGIESGHLQQKSVKVSKTGNLPTKRPRITQLEDSVSLAEVDGIKDMPDKLGPYLTKCNSAGNKMFTIVILNYTCVVNVCLSSSRLNKFIC